jgi:hypothetical protein
MMRRIAILALLLIGLLGAAWAQQPENLSQVGGTQVSLFATLLSSVAATATQSSSSAIRTANGGTYGVLQITESGITGSPSACVIALYAEPVAGTEGSTALTTVAFTPSTGVQTIRVAPSLPAVDQIVATFSCTTYPTAGTLSVSLAPQTSAWAEIHGAVWPASYTASKNFAASSTTDNACIAGNATNTVYVTAIKVSGLATTAAMELISVAKRSSADTGGTSASFISVPDDANYITSSTTPVSYTGSGPTAGAAIANIATTYLGFVATGSTTATVPEWVDDLRWKPIALRGTAQVLCLNDGVAGITGGEINVTFQWEERP